MTVNVPPNDSRPSFIPLRVDLTRIPSLDEPCSNTPRTDLDRAQFDDGVFKLTRSVSAGNYRVSVKLDSNVVRQPESFSEFSCFSGVGINYELTVTGQVSFLCALHLSCTCTSEIITLIKPLSACSARW